MSMGGALQGMYSGAVLAARIGAGALLGYYNGQHLGMYVGFLDGFMEDPYDLDLAFSRMETAKYWGGIFGGIEGAMDVVAPCWFRAAWYVGWGVYGAIDEFTQAYDAYVNNDPLLAMWKAGLGGSSLFLAVLMARACFAAGTPLLTPDGDKAIEHFKPGDLVLSRSEQGPDSPLMARRVVRTFTRSAFLLRLTVADRSIETTAEHPFWVVGKGWVNAGRVTAGDQLVTHDGHVVEVSSVDKTARFEPVYNIEVEEDHTYFVGRREWGWSIWAHNAAQCGDVRTLETPDGIYTEKIKWNAAGEVSARPDPAGPGQYWGPRQELANAAAEAYELQIGNGAGESFFLRFPDSSSPTGYRFAQFENRVGNTVIDGKRVVHPENSMYRVYDGSAFLQEMKQSSVLAEADRQLAAANYHGYNVKWPVSDATAASQLQTFFAQKGRPVAVTYTPPL